MIVQTHQPVKQDNNNQMNKQPIVFLKRQGAEQIKT